MELTAEQEADVQKIMAEMHCSKGFRCYKSGFEDLAPVEVIPGIGIVERAFRIPRTIWRFQNGLSTYLEYKRLGLDFDVVEHPDWGAEGWLFALIHTTPLVGHLHTPLTLITKHSQLPVTLDISLASSLMGMSIPISTSSIN